MNHNLTRQRIGAFEFDRHDRPLHEFRQKLQLDLVNLVGAIISSVSRQSFQLNEILPAPSDRDAFTKLGFTDIEYTAIEEIDRHMARFLSEINRSRGDATQGPGSEQS